ncbi:uracil-DNA glycosylase [Paenibacillus thermotolerans]|uniref:uracil-DNA glycosylase n=1 Tax=Paenibacillus thermotolerans TaxID=3027807 RepID=UPI002367A1D7|nr:MULTISPECIES: uracil-DNA glycosylase [unclassified Paenibacillus]
MLCLGNDWDELLSEEFTKPYFLKLVDFLEEEYRRSTVYPEQSQLYASLRMTPFREVKAVILGQDPYHGPGQAHGLSFSVRPGVAVPRSLRNIFKELHSDLGVAIPAHGNLEAWAKQGVLLLNTVLTVRDGEAGSHRGRGWETFTDGIIERLNARPAPLAFILWGAHAGEKRALIDESRHLVIASAHPSPLSARRGFFGSRPFSRTNEWLVASGMQEIDWGIPETD